MGRKKQGGQKPLIGIRMDTAETERLDKVAAELAARRGGEPNRADVFRLGIKLVEAGADAGGTLLDLIGVVSAGDGEDDLFPPGTTLKVSGLWPASTVVYLVRGVSMEDALIGDGDYILVRPQPEAKAGEIVVVWVPDKGTVVKLKRKKHYAHANERQDRDPIPFVEGCKEYGVLVGVIRKC